MKQHLETHFRTRGGRGKDKKAKGEGKGGDDVDRAEMQRLLREGAEKREREKGEREGRRRGREELDMNMSVSPRSLKAPRVGFEMGEVNQEVPYYAGRHAAPMDALDALATVAVGRK